MRCLIIRRGTRGESVRVDVPSRLYDPVIGADLYNLFG